MKLILKAINYSELSFKAQSDVLANINPKEKTELKIESNFKRTVIHNKLFDSQKILSLTCKIGSNQENKSPFSMNITILGIFEVLEGFDQREFEIKTTQLLFPYMRHAISTLTSMSGFPPIILPVLQDGILFPEDRQSSTGNNNSNRSVTND